jgi:hypothetical protein
MWCGHLHLYFGGMTNHFLWSKRIWETKKWALISCFKQVEYYKKASSLNTHTHTHTHTHCDSIITRLKLFLHNRTYPLISVILFKVVFRLCTKSPLIAPHLKHFMKCTVWNSEECLIIFLNGGDIVGFWVTHQLTSYYLWWHNFGSKSDAHLDCLTVLWFDWYEIATSQV